MSPSRLAELAAAAAAEISGAMAESEGTTTIWSAAGRPFAVLVGGVLEFRLDPIVGAAARRTPDTMTSARGDDWVAFGPPDLDRYAEDRVRAWFAAAHRRAGSVGDGRRAAGSITRKS